MSDPVRRRAALIATAVAVPFVVLAAFAISAVSGNSPTPSASPSTPPGPITAAAPPLATAQTANCAKVLAKLPVSLDGLSPRAVHTTPSTPFVVAWGNPPIVLSCGVAKPKQLYPGSSVRYLAVDGFAFVLDHAKNSTTYTSVDRAAFVSVKFSAGVQPATYLPTIADALRSALPAVCSTNSAAANPDTLCTRRT